MTVSFEVLAVDGRARHGRLETPHGTLETPAFAPVGTLGAVKGMTPDALEQVGADLMLANLYHLALRPGVDVVYELGGIHEFSGWRGPILTDSGGYQVFSLAKLRTIDRHGVTFRSHVDGNELRFTAERVARMQARMGVDLAMMLDECPPWPVGLRQAEESLARTLEWARQARPAWNGSGGFFGIVQGSTFRELRERAVRELVELDFDGYAIGGVSVGEPHAERRRVVEWVAPELPEDRVRYLMGVGTPADLVHAVGQGIDLFDCVLPSRNARHGQLYTRTGLVRIKNARYRNDARPIDAECECPACRRISRAFLHHLIRAGELTGQVLATLHNLCFYLDFVGDLRKATAAGSLAEFARGVSGIVDASELETASSERPQKGADDPPSQD